MPYYASGDYSRTWQRVGEGYKNRSYGYNPRSNYNALNIKTPMAYNKNYSRPYGQNRFEGQKRKRSGAKTKIGKNGKMVVVAWKATRYGMLSILVGETKYTKTVESKNRRVWKTGMSVSIVNKNTGATNFKFGMMDVQTGKVIVKDLGWVINPQGGPGGVVARIGGKPRR